MLLEVRNLTLSVPYREGRQIALHDLNLSLPEAGSLGIVGESGSGKSLTALAVAGLSASQVRRETGSIQWEGQEMTVMSPEQLRALRGRALAMIFQDSGNALNPLMRACDQVIEGLLLFDGLDLRQAERRAADLFQEVELPSSALRKYPHELSGGQRQRVMIALALARQPRLLIADEPTTALDLTTQQQLLRVLKRLCRERRMALLLISHDINVVRELTDRLVVLYAGAVMESGPSVAVLRQPGHPYTQGLLGAMPSFIARGRRLTTLEGVAARLDARPAQGCVFFERCPHAMPSCREAVSIWNSAEGVEVRCNLQPAPAINQPKE